MLEEVVSRIFKRFRMIYGAGRVASMSNGMEPEELRDYWVNGLSGFADKLPAVGTVLDALEDEVERDTFPPTMGEFRKLCREAAKRLNPPQNLQLGFKPDPEKQRRFSAELAEIVKGENRGNDPIFWATHPRSQQHLAFIIDAARKDPMKFQPCLEKLVADGRATPDGKLLHRYRGFGKWESL